MPNVKLDLDLGSMSADDRSAIASILHRALEYLSDGDEDSQSERAGNNDVNRDEQAGVKDDKREKPRKTSKGQRKKGVTPRKIK